MEVHFKISQDLFHFSAWSWPKGGPNDLAQFSKFENFTTGDILENYYPAAPEKIRTFRKNSDKNFGPCEKIRTKLETFRKLRILFGDTRVVIIEVWGIFGMSENLKKSLEIVRRPEKISEFPCSKIRKCQV